MGTEGWRDRRRERRVRKGNGEPLPPLRWWQVATRSLLRIDLTDPGTTITATYTVDVDHLGDRADGAVRARLYRDGRLLSLASLPARFPVPGGNIEVAVGTFGLRRCHFVAATGAVHQLTPLAGSAEGRRARLAAERPGLSRAIGATSTLVVLAGVGLAVPQLLEGITAIPPVQQAVGAFELAIEIPLAVNIAAGVATVVGSIERALRLRSNWLDDLAN
ncbi:hypothetical protein [Curtobacterium sp. MCBD17_008]|uniref:hypothetical protein n=1 Tax=Curtobacterium sp. MCBD17_008 TaxID=2175656 RepID=UPI000DA73289|nr:hypothetical protein [Curtobacterium sp. MCBD17_008]PZE92854.1 hypothetical protein DEI95_07785 [Curtobacterium sp. MCBD17_008]